MGDSSDLPSLLYADEPTAREKLAAQIAALRGDQGFAGLAQLSGDPVLGKFGTGLAGHVQHQQDALNEVPQQRARLAQENLTLQKGQREAAAETDPQTAVLRRSLAKSYTSKFAPELGAEIDKAPAGVLATTLKQLEDRANHYDAAEARKVQLAGTMAFRDQQFTEKQLKALGDSLDPRHRSSGLSKFSDRLAAIDSGLGGVIAPGDDLNSLNAQKMYELARVYDRVVSAGQPTQGGTSHLVPSTALGSAADFAQWLTGSPVGKQQGAFAKQMVDALNREKEIASKQISESQRSKVARAAWLSKKGPQEFANTLSAAGLNPGEFDQDTWLYKGQPKAAAGPAASAAPKVDPGVIQKYKASLQPGERLVIDQTGNAHALSAGEALPQGFTEVP